MCGIAGLVGERDPSVLQAMLDTIAHRGPDDEGQVWRETSHRWVGLGNRRLAILDLSPAGHQPMTVGDAAIAYNGEVYNHLALRRELESQGERFFSTTDTEVVLRLLMRHGEAGLYRLNGMFAIAFWDPSRQELLLARDRFGIKPLYYCQEGCRLVFASEAKALFKAGVSARLNVRRLSSYLSFGFVPGEETMYEGVRELPPGHVLRCRNDAFQLEELLHTHPEADPTLGRREAAERLRQRLQDSIARQSTADVPVGVLLSGGLDSSAVAALAATTSRRPVHAYTIAQRGGDATAEQNPDDARFARLVAERFGMELHEFVVSPDVAGLLDSVAWHLDDPVADVAAALTLMISRAAAREVKVLLSGMGSDEILAGYRPHLYHRVAEPLSHVPTLVRRAASRSLDLLPRIARKVPGIHPGLLLAAHRGGRYVLDHAHLPADRRYVAFVSAAHFSPSQLSSLLRPEVRELALEEDPHAVHLRHLAEPDQVDFVSRMLYTDVKTYMANQTLVYTDRLSMAASIEVRVPFLDDEVADLALAIPSNQKIRNLRGKVVLRDAMEGLLPAEVINRRKAGFGAPIRSWLSSGELQPVLGEALSNRWLNETGLFERRAVRRLIDDHASGQADHTHRIWTVLSFALWHRAHFG